MKGLEKLTSIRLAEVLSQKNVVPADAITDALYSQDRLGEAFVEVLVSGGHITEWDLAKVVVEHFQAPFIMASNYDIGAEAKDRLPKDVLFDNLLVPLDVFDHVVVVAMPILAPWEAMDKIQSQYECEIFPYVGLLTENKKVLQDLFGDFNDYLANQEAEREKQRRVATESKKGEGDWANMFDSADAAIRDSLTG